LVHIDATGTPAVAITANANDLLQFGRRFNFLNRKDAGDHFSTFRTHYDNGKAPACVAPDWHCRQR
jgi:hypothetical protein